MDGTVFCHHCRNFTANLYVYGQCTFGFFAGNVGAVFYLYSAVALFCAADANQAGGAKTFHTAETTAAIDQSVFPGAGENHPIPTAEEEIMRIIGITAYRNGAFDHE